MVRLGRMTDSEKDLEILILRHQLDILERKQKRKIKPNQAEKLFLAVLTARLKKATNRPAGRLRDVLRIFQPETVLRWHRELVRRKWTFKRKAKGGRPRISQELEALSVRLARENGRWVTQQARQIVWALEEDAADVRVLIHDNDSKFSATFDTVFQSEGLHVIHTPFQVPNANAVAERWVRSAREECLDHLLVLNQANLRRVLNTFIDYYNTARPHQGLAQQSPITRHTTCAVGSVQRRDVLGGIIGDYNRAPDNTALVLS